MKLEYAARVEKGRREGNDDRLLVGGKILDMECAEGELEIPAIAVVCDGCGGYAGGGIAARVVLERIAEMDPAVLSYKECLEQVLDGCQRAVEEQQKEQPQFSAMCTTIAGCVFCQDRILVFHAGDSRVYRKDKWGVARMTKDHSIVQELVDMGELAPEDAWKHPDRSVIRRCIGIDGLPPEIYISHAAAAPGETYLICSDGLWESVSELEIGEILGSGLPLRQVADLLVEKALQQGADDNISVCVCSGQGEAEVQEKKPFILD